MGRTIKDRHDLNDDDIDFDEIDDLDEDLDVLLNDSQPLKMQPKRTRKKRGQKVPFRPDNFPTDLKDWRDPEDDIMYGFRE